MPKDRTINRINADLRNSHSRQTPKMEAPKVPKSGVVNTAIPVFGGKPKGFPEPK